MSRDRGLCFIYNSVSVSIPLATLHWSAKISNPVYKFGAVIVYLCTILNVSRRLMIYRHEVLVHENKTKAHKQTLL